MPAWRADRQTRTIRRYDIAGTDSKTPHFIGHVALATKDHSELSDANASIDVVHMQPPFQFSQPYKFPVNAFGTAELDAGHELQVKIFVDERKLEYEAQSRRRKDEYIILPAAKAPDRDRPFWRFSCAGFVLEAYKTANIVLLDDASSEFPLISLEEIKAVYNFDLLDKPEVRYQLGLEGDGPWPVVLAGYVLNSLNRSAEEIKSSAYVPVHKDSYFPNSSAATKA